VQDLGGAYERHSATASGATVVGDSFASGALTVLTDPIVLRAKTRIGQVLKLLHQKLSFRNSGPADSSASFPSEGGAASRRLGSRLSSSRHDQDPRSCDLLGSAPRCGVDGELRSGARWETKAEAPTLPLSSAVRRLEARAHASERNRHPCESWTQLRYLLDERRGARSGGVV
jgi:hypothetical protein